jgi:hypothetical protein
MDSLFRTSNNRLNEIASQLSPRELAVIETIERLQLVSGSQLQRLHFTNGTPRSNTQIRNTTLHRLTEQRILARLPRKIGGYDSGSAEYIYCFDRAGQRLVNQQKGEVGRAPRTPTSPTYPFIAHMLAVSEVYVQLMEAQEAGQIELAEFQTEPQCYRTISHNQRLKPDGYVRLYANDKEIAWFLEIERSVQTAYTTTHKLVAFWAYANTLGKDDLIPLTLFLVPDERRKARLLKVIQRQSTADQKLFSITTFDQAVSAITKTEP